jgi:xanthine dehydrogenase iron-sulfur cluster and FAD-binding subunit A
MWRSFQNATSVVEVIKTLDEQGEGARIIAGATDLILEIERGVRSGIETLIDVTRIQGLDRIEIDEYGVIHLGPLVTHNQCAASKLIVERAFPLAQAAWEVGAPQIRNRGTVAGNLITASPANDTIPPLMALGAQVTLKSRGGERIVPLSEFYRGVRKTVMQPEEMLIDISIPAMKRNQKGAFVKLGLRRAQAISIVNAAMLVTFRDRSSSEGPNSQIEDVVITLGSVAPTIIHASQPERYLKGRRLDQDAILYAAELAKMDAKPIADIRSGAEYRNEMVRVCVERGLHAISQEEERKGFPDNPVLLWDQRAEDESPRFKESTVHTVGSLIKTRINGKEYKFSTGHNKTLLRLLREDTGLIGTKEGCAEGECGACTVFLDGKAVMSCLVPAARAHGAEVLTIEGMASNDILHPVQQAFIDAGAVQCGYCTPGFIMSGIKLLEEKPHPTHLEIQQAITGNLCRCTGYYKIIQAIEHASQLD